MSQLEQIWKRQVAYNQRVRSTENPADYEYWMKQYLLGAVAEVDEILQETNWKKHRRGKPMNRHNLARELADLTKFVFCLWEWSGFGPHDMLQFVDDKSWELEQQWKQDFEVTFQPNSHIVITDLDGTVGNWRAAFRDWLLDNDLAGLPTDPATTLSFEVDMQLPYPLYVQFKEQFEASGGYRTLKPYNDAVEALLVLGCINTQIIAYTARPARAHTRIWSDTWQWLEEIGLKDQVLELRIGAEDRIIRACDLTKQGHKVVMLEDDPGLAIRAASAGVTVFMRAQPYNLGVMHPLIIRVDTFDATTINKWMEGKLYDTNS